MERRNRRNLLLVLLFVGILPILTSCALFISSDGRLRLYRVYYAKEVVAEVYVVPGILSISPLPATHVTYEQTVYRATNKNFFLRATLSGGAKFSSTGAEPVLAYAHNAGGDDPTVSPLVGASAQQSYVEWLVTVTTGFTGAGDGAPRWTIDLTGVAINAGQILQNGGAVELTVSTRDSSTGEPFDTPVTGKFMVGVPGFTYYDGTLINGRATVDLDQEEKVFVPDALDSTTMDRGADVGGIGPGIYIEEEEGEITPGEVFVFAPDGNAYLLSPDDQLELTFSSNLSAISRILIGVDDREYVLTDADRASSSVTLTVPGDVVNYWATITVPPDGPPIPLSTLPVTSPLPVAFEVKGDEPIRTRIITVEMRLRLENGYERQLLPPTEITRWVINGSVLVAPWVNGNDQALTTQVSLMNHSGRSGTIKARVLSMPRVGTPTEDLGSVMLGVLPANGTASFNLGEQVLAPLSLRPYLQNGGNLSLEVTIAGANASGVTTVYGPTVAFGTTRMIRSSLSVVE